MECYKRMDPSQLSVGIAFLAGLVSFLSPCMLPLVPIFLAQLVGQSTYQSTHDQGDQPARLLTFLRVHQFQLRQVGGILLIIIGLHLIGIVKIPFLYWQKRFAFHPTRPSYPASLLIGVIFAIGWTPCISLFLGSILGLAATAATLRQGVMLLLFYSLGMGLPFLLLGLGLDQVSRVLKWLKPHLGKIEVATGVVMILVGVMIYFNWLVYLNRYFTPFIRL